MAIILLYGALLAACSPQPQLAPLDANATILAFGDSLTYGTGVSQEYSYPFVLEKISGFEVVSSGVPGEVSAAGVKRLAEVLSRERPDLVILCHGGNDVLRRLSASSTERNLKQMIQMARSSGAEVVLLAIPKFGIFPEPWDYYESIQEEFAVPVDFETITELEKDASMKSDRVHFNKEGYRKLAEASFLLLKDAGAILH